MEDEKASGAFGCVRSYGWDSPFKMVTNKFIKFTIYLFIKPFLCYWDPSVAFESSGLWLQAAASIPLCDHWVVSLLPSYKMVVAISTILNTN